MINHKLAYEIASTLHDLDNLKLHEDFTETYSEEFLRKTLNKVLSIPERKIKKDARRIIHLSCSKKWQGPTFSGLVREQGIWELRYSEMVIFTSGG